MWVSLTFALLLVSPRRRFRPGTAEDDRKRELWQYHEAVKRAKNVLVAGGGPCGVELAGDLRLLMQGPGGAKGTLTLVHDGDFVLGPAFSTRERRIVTDKMRAAPGMRLVPHDRVVGAGASEPACAPGRAYALRSGGRVEADVYFPAFGRGRCGFLAPLGDGVVDARGRVLVEEATMQCAAAPALFAAACTDQADRDGHVNMMTIPPAAKVAARNALAYVRGQPLKATYKRGGDAPPGLKHEPAQVFGHGYWATLFHDNCGPAGLVARACGWPLGCCCCPLLGCRAGPCGFNCMAARGKGLALVLDKMLRSGKGGPMLDKVDRKAGAPPSEELMQR